MLRASKTPLFLILAMTFANFIPVYAVDIPECQFSGQPTAEQIQACEQAQRDSASTPTQTVPTGQTTAPTTNDSPNIDLSGYPTPPSAIEGAPNQEFMGKPLNGPDMDEIAAKLGAALESIKEGLTQAEEGIAEMKEGQIKVDPNMEKSVKAARPIYEQAVAIYASGDYLATADKLKELEAVGFNEKFKSYAENNGISVDMINDIRKKLKEALATIEKMVPEEERVDAQADIMTQLNYLDDAEKLIKAGKKKEAIKILKDMRKKFGEGEAEATLGKKDSMMGTRLGKILNKLNTELTNAGNGIAKAKSKGVTITSELENLINQAKSLYDEAKNYYDKGDYQKTADTLKKMQEMKLKERSLAFRDKMMTKDAMKKILDEGKNGAKA